MENYKLIESVLDNYDTIKNPKVTGRYVAFDDIKPELHKLPELFQVEQIGSSVLKVPIHSVTFGTGPVKILGWSQMHGNESTTTKSVFDLFKLFSQEELPKPLSAILQNCTIKIIPMLNPDGAVRYTRVNVNEVDLNRDAHELKEEESKVLRNCYNDFQPHFCLNLHDQRTIFGAGDDRKPATLSFLAPSMDEERSIPENRKKAMQLIAAMNSELREFLPGQIGRFDDAFNINCTGDTFQALEVPTILFEAGHYQDDYQREKTREYVTIALLLVLLHISADTFKSYTEEEYFKIPENRKSFFDVILRNALIEGEIKDVAIQFEEKIKSGKIFFEPVVQNIADSLASYGHQEIDCKGAIVKNATREVINENAIVDQILLNNNKFSIKTSDFVQ